MHFDVAGLMDDWLLERAPKEIRKIIGNEERRGERKKKKGNNRKDVDAVVVSVFGSDDGKENRLRRGQASIYRRRASTFRS